MPDDLQKVAANPTNTGGSADALRFTPGEINAPGGWSGDAKPPPEPPKPDAELAPKPGEEPPLKEGEIPKPEGKEKPKEEVKPPEEEVFDPEKLTPAQRKEFDRLKTAETRVQELEGRLSTQGRELSAAKKVVEEKIATHEQVMKQNETDFNKAYADTIAYCRQMETTANDYEAQAQEVQEGNPELAAQYRAEAAQARNEFVKFDQKKVRMQTQYDNWYRYEIVKHANDVENAFLESFPEFREVKDKFESFCQDVGISSMQAKKNVDTLHKMYRRCLQSERGSDAAIAKIKADSDALALELARKKNAASAPDGGSSARPTPKKKEEEDDWTKQHFPRHNLPDSPADFKRAAATAK